MPELFGREFRRADLMRRVGSLNQVAGIRQYAYRGGHADGVEAVEVSTGPLRYEVLASRCLDIGFASCRGVPFGYASKSGLRHPGYFNRMDPDGFRDSFLGGVLTTCGLDNIGPATERAGRRFQMHGDLANLPAERVSVDERWIGDDCLFTVSGVVRHGGFYRGETVLRRTVSSRLGATSLSIEDEVENCDFDSMPCLLLYHAQFGFPILGADSSLITSPVREITARPGTPVAAVDQSTTFADPEDGAGEACFYRVLNHDDRGWAGAAIFNSRLGPHGTGAYIRYDTSTLPYLVQWKMLRSREYVCGLEPATALLEERDARAMDAVTLQPGEIRRFRLEIGVVEGEDECRCKVGADRT